MLILSVQYILEQIVIPFGVVFFGGVLASVAAEVLLKNTLCLTLASKSDLRV